MKIKKLIKMSIKLLNQNKVKATEGADSMSLYDRDIMTKQFINLPTTRRGCFSQFLGSSGKSIEKCVLCSCVERSKANIIRQNNWFSPN